MINKNNLIKSKDMKTIRTVVILLLCLGFLLSVNSCVVFLRKDNGNHKGWYKNQNNPHNPYSTNKGKPNGSPK
jgi:hypothetical protein